MDLQPGQIKNRWLTYKQLEELTSFKRNTIFKWWQKGDFPAPYSIGEQKKLFKESEVRSWMEEKEDGSQATIVTSLNSN